MTAAPLVLDALRARAAASPDGLFCQFISAGREQAITCRQALAASARYADLYRSRGLERGDIVLIVLRHAPDLYFAFLGAMLAGCIPSFMPFPSAKQDPELYRSQHRALFERIGARAVVTFAENAATLAAIAPQLAVLTPADADGRSEASPEIEIAPDDIAFLQHSSGTTGLKKGVMLSHGAVAAQAARYGAELGLTPQDRIVSWLPLYHDMGLIACFVLPLSLGVPFVSLDAFEWTARPGLLFDAIARHGGTHVWLPNFAFHHLARSVAGPPTADLSGVKAFIDCSEPCRLETFELFERAFGDWGVRSDQLRICYAMAETVFAVTQTPAGEAVRSIEREGRRIPSVGRPIADVELSIIDPSGEPMPGGQVGEVATRAPFLFSGYHNDPERTGAKLRDGWYRTGDLGLMLEGELYLLGRADDQIIVNGRNILAHDVEFLLNAEVEQIKAGRCVALGVFEPEIGSLQLVILAEPAGEVDAQAIARKVKQIVLTGFGVTPREVKLVPPGWLAKTTSGKLSRELNLGKYLAEQALETA
jgi:acyl-CoA synthetase (AMP-forming)/AMP-acid ligase II